MEDNSSPGDSRAVFSITNLLNEQIGKLSLTKPDLVKTVSIDGVDEKNDITGSEVDWEEILKIFYEIEISSPRMAGIYNLQEYDSGIVHVSQYVRKPGEKAKVEFLRIEEYPDGSMNISSKVVQNNPIYSSSSYAKILLVNTERSGLLIQRFQLEGYQKIIARDSVQYTIDGVLNN
ncbi:hypothetical protein ACFLU5_06440 [Bacteroidota bacterium]